MRDILTGLFQLDFECRNASRGHIYLTDVNLVSLLSLRISGTWFDVINMIDVVVRGELGAQEILGLGLRSSLYNARITPKNSIKRIKKTYISFFRCRFGRFRIVSSEETRSWRSAS